MHTHIHTVDQPMAGHVRLSGSTANSAYGVVEYYHGDTQTWVTPCVDFWDDEDANVACVQLGYESGTAQVYSVSSL